MGKKTQTSGAPQVSTFSNLREKKGAIRLEEMTEKGHTKKASLFAIILERKKGRPS